MKFAIKNTFVILIVILSLFISSFQRRSRRRSLAKFSPSKRIAKIQRPIQMKSIINRPSSNNYPSRNMSSSQGRLAQSSFQSPSPLTPNFSSSNIRENMSNKRKMLISSGQAKNNNNLSVRVPPPITALANKPVESQPNNALANEAKKQNNLKKLNNIANKPKQKYYYTPSTPKTTASNYYNTGYQGRNYVTPYYHNHVHYPFYAYYMYNYDYYKTLYPGYFNHYLSHSFPYLHYHGPLILMSGRSIFLNSSNNSPSSFSNQLRKCQNGPIYNFTVRVNGKKYRVFLGDVNDLFNVQCLYMMTAIISVGKEDHSQKISQIFNNPSKSMNMNGKEIVLNPFKGAEYVPTNIQLQNVNPNFKIMTFDLEKSSLPSKRIIFYHSDNFQENEDIFRDLSTEAPSGNVLFIVDQLQRKSVEVFQNLLVKYKNYTPLRLRTFRYKNVHIFPRTIVRNWYPGRNVRHVAMTRYHPRVFYNHIH